MMFSHRRCLDDILTYEETVCDVPVKLDANESPFNLPPLVEERIFNRLQSVSFNRYPADAVFSLSDQLTRHFGVGALLGNGSSELIEKTFFAFASPRHSVVFPNPSFSMFRIYAQLSGANIVEVPLNTGGTLNVDAFINAVNANNASLAVVCNPNNPTGSSIPLDMLRFIADNVKCPFLVDEAYGEFADVSAIALINRLDNLIVTKTFSKAFGLAACRIGYLLTNKDMAAFLKKVFMPYHINELSAAVADIVFQMRHEFEPLISLITGERQRLFNALSAIDGISPFESHANFIFLRAVPQMDFVIERRHTMQTIKFFVPCDPVPMSRPKVNKNGGVYYPDRVKAFVENVRLCANLSASKQKWKILTNPVSVALSFGKKILVANYNYGDIDNFAKGVLDAMNGVIYMDDRQVVNLFASKHLINTRKERNEADGVLITVTDDVNYFFNIVKLYMTE